MEIWNTLCGRWKNRMPKFFRWMFGAGMTISGTAAAVQEYHNEQQGGNIVLDKDDN